MRSAAHLLASDCTDSPVRLLSSLGVVMSCVAKILPGFRDLGFGVVGDRIAFRAWGIGAYCSRLSSRKVLLKPFA